MPFADYIAANGEKVEAAKAAEPEAAEVVSEEDDAAEVVAEEDDGGDSGGGDDDDDDGDDDEYSPASRRSRRRRSAFRAGRRRAVERQAPRRGEGDGEGAKWDDDNDDAFEAALAADEARKAAASSESEVVSGRDADVGVLVGRLHGIGACAGTRPRAKKRQRKARKPREIGEIHSNNRVARFAAPRVRWSTTWRARPPLDSMRARTAALCGLAVGACRSRPPQGGRAWWRRARVFRSKSLKGRAPAEPPKRKRRRKGPSMVAVCVFIGFCLLVLEQGLTSPENNLLGRLATLRPACTPRASRHRAGRRAAAPRDRRLQPALSSRRRSGSSARRRACRRRTRRQRIAGGPRGRPQPTRMGHLPLGLFVGRPGGLMARSYVYFPITASRSVFCALPADARGPPPRELRSPSRIGRSSSPTPRGSRSETRPPPAPPRPPTAVPSARCRGSGWRRSRRCPTSRGGALHRATAQSARPSRRRGARAPRSRSASCAPTTGTCGAPRRAAARRCRRAAARGSRRSSCHTKVSPVPESGWAPAAAPLDATNPNVRHTSSLPRARRTRTHGPHALARRWSVRSEKPWSWVE